METCIICGCYNNSACNHHTAGFCWWHLPGLCSHCAHPTLFLEAERPTKNTAYKIAEIKPGLFRNMMARLNFKIKIQAYTLAGSKRYLIRLINFDQREAFYDLMKAWYPEAKADNEILFDVDIQRTRAYIEGETFLKKAK